MNVKIHAINIHIPTLLTKLLPQKEVTPPHGEGKIQRILTSTNLGNTLHITFHNRNLGYINCPQHPNQSVWTQGPRKQKLPLH